MLIALFARGHCLLVGVPGPGQDADHPHAGRFAVAGVPPHPVHPDLMPSDITGTEVIQEDKATGQRTLQFLRGPISAS